jgi:hypothetical protein
VGPDDTVYSWQDLSLEMFIIPLEKLIINFFISFGIPGSPLVENQPFGGSGVASPASDVIVVMGGEPDVQAARTMRALESEQQNGDIEWR